MFIEPEKITEADTVLTANDRKLINEFADEYLAIKQELTKYSMAAMARHFGKGKATVHQALYSDYITAPWGQEAKQMLLKKNRLKKKAALCSPEFVAEKFYISQWVARKLFNRRKKETEK